MQLSSVLSALLISSMAAAAPLNHAHHQHEKRAYATVEVTQLVTVTAGDEPTSSPQAETTTSAPVEATTTSAEVDAETKNKVGTTSSSSTSSTTSSTAETTSSATSFTESSSTEASSSTSSAAEASSSSSAASGSVASYAQQAKGITYSPYTDSGSCKSSSTIASDIELLSSYDVIRVYAPDCSCVSAIMGTMGSNQKLFAGVYYYDNISSDLELLKTQVEGSSQGWDGIYAVAIGNEWVQNGEYSASAVASAVSSARSTLTGYGFSGSVVTVDTVGAYNDNSELCDASDFIAVNAHPYWNGATAPEDSGSFLTSQISGVKSACNNDKSVLITETGWPTQGDTYGTLGVPSLANQLSAIKSIIDAGLGDQCLMFTTYNDLWKDGGSYGVEKYWGIYQN